MFQCFRDFCFSCFVVCVIVGCVRYCFGCDNEVAAAKWPVECQGDIGYVVDWSGFRAEQIGLSQDEAAAAIRRGAAWWNAAIDARIYERQDWGPRSRFRIDWLDLAGSILARSSLADERCTDDKSQAYDRRRWDAHTLTVTAAHEFGHMLGLGHRRGNYVMNPEILPALAGLTDQDIRDAFALGYGRRVGPVPLAIDESVDDDKTGALERLLLLLIERLADRIQDTERRELVVLLVDVLRELLE